MIPKIPDTLITYKCRICMYYRPDKPNVDRLQEGPFFPAGICYREPEVEFTEGMQDCLTFRVMGVYGLCITCQYADTYAPNYCLIKPKNRVRLYRTNNQEYDRSQTDLCTCDNYHLSVRDSRSLLLEPTTWPEPIEDVPNTEPPRY